MFFGSSFSLFVTGLFLLTAATPSLAAKPYEVWAPDQSNSVEGQDALGVRGGWLWIWDSKDIASMLATSSTTAEARAATGTTPPSLPCSPDASMGPCELFTMFPETLTDSESGEPLSDAMGFGRWHGISKDPQHKYVTASIFAPGGGFVGIVDTDTKEAVGLFRATEFFYSTGPDTNATTRNVHYSYWSHDGGAILINNLAGKALERINVERDDTGKITSLSFDKSATLGFGKSMQVTTEASWYSGTNAFGNDLMGGLTGSYEDADLGDLTPTGTCKENGCSTGADDAAMMPGRPNNVPICPIPAANGMVFNTMGGGGLLVVDSTTTPMTVVGAYGNNVVFGAGVCGIQVSDYVYLTSGASASGAGADQSMFALFAFDPTLYGSDMDYEENGPTPLLVFDDETGTATGGKTVGNTSDDSGQLPGITTRRDAHDVAGTADGKYVHVIDRVQNVVEVFDSSTNEHVGKYDLTTETGMMGDGTVGPCAAASVTDGGNDFPINDPAPDFIDHTPDGTHMVISFRGPAPVSAGHAAQGSCPGVGIVELSDGGMSGKLVGVLRSTNTVPDNVGTIQPAGGALYTGAERSDIHDTVVVFKEAMTEDPEDEDNSETSGTSAQAVISFMAIISAAFTCFIA